MSGGILDRVQPHLLSAPPYVPVLPPETLAQRLGLPVESILKLDANENQFGPSPKALEALAKARSYHIYPDPEQAQLRQTLGRYVDYGPEWLVAGAGSDELIELALRLFVPPGEAILNFPPTFGMYTFLADTLGQKAINVNRRADHSIDMEAALAAVPRTRLIFAVSPNNPTGTSLTRAELDALLATGLPVVVDEAYAEFAGESYAPLVREHSNLIVIRTLSKWAGLAGLRIGYMIADPSLMEIAMRVKQPYSVNVAAEVATLASFEDLPLLHERVAAIVSERERLAALLASLPGFEAVPSRANFILVRLNGIEAKQVQARLREKGIMIRYFDSPLLQNHLRISVGLPRQTDRLVAALGEIVNKLSAENRSGVPRA
ncbi:MAG: histidinol-phosphate transaminase [Dehalococcoidia bacterium]|nr:histidinol-phosphate transaminase [Dehalococcoidia bacterium]